MMTTGGKIHMIADTISAKGGDTHRVHRLAAVPGSARNALSNRLPADVPIRSRPVVAPAFIAPSMLFAYRAKLYANHCG